MLRLRRLAPAGALVVLATTGCSLIDLLDLRDSPTHWTQATPVRMACNGKKIVFKSPGESYNAGFFGGPITKGHVLFAGTAIPRSGAG